MMGLLVAQHNGEAGTPGQSFRTCESISCVCLDIIHSFSMFYAITGFAIFLPKHVIYMLLFFLSAACNFSVRYVNIQNCGIMELLNLERMPGYHLDNPCAQSKISLMQLCFESIRVLSTPRHHNL